MSVFKISNIILPVSNLNRSVAFYKNNLGMKVISIIPGDFAFLDGGEVTLALRERTAGSDPGMTEVVFELPDVYAAYESLKSKGLVFSTNPRVVTESDTRQLVAADFRDPDGHILSITSWLPKK